MAARGDIHALVAGVSHYLPGRASDETYPPLAGCAADAREVALYLTGELGVPAGNVCLLTSSAAGGSGPIEPPEQRPGYAQLTAALASLGRSARPGDQVLVYFAGHGGRMPTLVPEVKGEGGLDECLVPFDAGEGGRLLRDIEIAAAVASLASGGRAVTLALDCCHAGGALRAPGRAAVRGVSFVDTAPRPAESTVASQEVLAAAWRAAGGFTPAGAVLLAACRPGELALEVLLDGRQRGIFTWALLEALRRLGTGVAYRRLHERVMARVRVMFEIQTPFLEGDAERRVLGGEPRRPTPSVPVLVVAPDSVLLAAGVPQGVGTGAWFAVHPLGAEDLSRIEERVALVEVTEAGASNSRARIATRLRADATVEQGAPAVLLGTGGLGRKRVAVLEGAGSPLLSQVEERLAGPDGSGFVDLCPAGGTADLFLALQESGAVQILDAAGEPLAELDDAASPVAVIGALEHLARFRNVQELENADPGSDLYEKVVASLDRLPGPWRPRMPIRPQPFPSLPPTVRPGDWLCLSIENHSVQELNIAVLNLQADWSIRQAFPTGQFFPLDAGARQLIPFEVRWPFRRRHGRDVLKVFAASGPVDFRWLELPALGEPPLSLPRSLLAAPLVAFFAALTGLPLRSRALAPERQPQHAWTVCDLATEVDADAR
jgi:hypothetical protein